MKRIKIALYLTALCGLCALGGATSASAANPEFLPASGTFLSTSGVGQLQTSGGTKVGCTSDKDKGLISGPESVDNVLVTFHGCKTGIFTCTSGTEPSGLITTKELSGLLGWINKSALTVGLDLAPTSGTEFVEFNCAGELVKVKVRGSVIGKVTPLNTKTTSGLLTYKQSGGVQELTKFEGGAVDLLETSKNGGAFEGSAEATVDEITFHQPTEVMA